MFARRSKPSLPQAAEETPRTGVPLPAASRAFFESRFHHDFSRVRIHSGHDAAQSARSLGAAAYTNGSDIVFGSHRFDPETARGHRLLAHELAHVAQRDRGVAPERAISARGDADELHAERAAAAVSWGALRPRYGDVAGDVVPASGRTPVAAVPAFNGLAALFQLVQLTYDDGPDSAGNTKAVLDALNAAGARATFYLVGKRVAQGKNWKTVFDIAAAGHWLGNHAFDWNDATDNHIFLAGTAEERAQKILNTEWSIRDALITGRDDAKTNKTWDAIPQANRDYIDDVIAHGTGRFRTPGFKSKTFKKSITSPLDHDGITTQAALAEANEVLAGTGLRPLKMTEIDPWYMPKYEGVTVDPHDYEKGKTQSDIESSVKGGVKKNDDSILLHSRVAASAAATPAIVSDIQKRKFTFDPTVQGKLGSVSPVSGFLRISFSDPPTAAEVGAARAAFMKDYLMYGPVVSGHLALNIFQLAQRVGPAEALAFAAEIKATKVTTKEYGVVPMSGWMMASEEWRLFSSFFENWMTGKPFPKIPGVTI